MPINASNTEIVEHLLSVIFLLLASVFKYYHFLYFGSYVVLDEDELSALAFLRKLGYSRGSKA